MAGLAVAPAQHFILAVKKQQLGPDIGLLDQVINLLQEQLDVEFAVSNVDPNGKRLNL